MMSTSESPHKIDPERTPTSSSSTHNTFNWGGMDSPITKSQLMQTTTLLASPLPDLNNKTKSGHSSSSSHQWQKTTIASSPAINNNNNNKTPFLSSQQQQRLMSNQPSTVSPSPNTRRKESQSLNRFQFEKLDENFDDDTSEEGNDSSILRSQHHSRVTRDIGNLTKFNTIGKSTSVVPSATTGGGDFSSMGLKQREKVRFHFNFLF